MNKILEKLNLLDDNYILTKPIKKPKKFTKVKDIIPFKEDYNYMADLLMLPTTSEGYRYLLTVVDLANDECDFEPIKNKEAKSVLEAMKTIFTRPYLKKPYASIRTDDGNEFKSVFHKYLYDENILHRIANPGRHTQTANVESLNKQLGLILNLYMNQKEMQTKKQYNDWTDIIDLVRIEINQMRKKDLNKLQKIRDNKKMNYFHKEPKFKVGDLVHYKLDEPKNALNNKQNTKNFRMGDIRYAINPRKIKKNLYYEGAIPYRYILNQIPNVSYTENELLLSKQNSVDDNNKTEEKFEIKKIIDKRRYKNTVQYKIWWQGSLKKDSTWENKKRLIEDGIKPLIDAYEESLKK